MDRFIYPLVMYDFHSAGYHQAHYCSAVLHVDLLGFLPAWAVTVEVTKIFSFKPGVNFSFTNFH
jgi:hypothetical protein